MKQRCISISEDMHEKLKEESNASELIDNLLREHYSYVPPEALNKAVAILEGKDKLKVWGTQFREVQATQGRTTDELISEWVDGCSEIVQRRWREFLENA
jgi:hypothetical protein